MKIRLLIAAFTACLPTSIAWDPDAGLMVSYTKSAIASVSSTSGSYMERVIDGDDNTNWVSGSCLPNFYMNRPDVNVLFGKCHEGKCAVNGVDALNMDHVTDGTPYTSFDVHSFNKSVFSLTLDSPTILHVISLSGKYNDDVHLYAVASGSKHFLQAIGTSSNYQNVNTFPPNVSITAIELVSNSSFNINELSALAENGCIERITVDLGANKHVGTVRTRHWAGTNSTSHLVLMLSTDRKSWKTVAELDPNTLRAITTSVSSQVARYIAMEYTVNLRNYNKVYCYEIDAWDEHGAWGPPIASKPQTKTFRELLGVNGIWGWGTQKYSSQLTNDMSGPLLYNKLASHARNYHNLNWDVTDPDTDPEYSEMAAGRGTQAKWWLNWDTEYGAWKNANLTIDVSIQFTNQTSPQYVWNTPEQSAFHYGQEFAKHFGAAKGNGLVNAVEVGNEPWDYDAAFYVKVLKGMSSGIRSIDSTLIVAPAAFQADSKYETSNYIGTRVLQDVAINIDVINGHTYSFINDLNGVRRGTYPENKLSSFNSIKPLVRWRDANTPNKQLWITEWGWDADGAGEDCDATECVTEHAQAVYAFRGLMILSRSNVARATWYFYANSDCSTLFCRSGLTSSQTTHFQRKTVFGVLEEVLELVGNSYFFGVVQESYSGYVYALTNSKTQPVFPTDTQAVPGNTSHIVAWLPVDINDPKEQRIILQLSSGMHVQKGIRFTGQSVDHPTEVFHSYSQNGHMLTLTISRHPVIVEFSHAQNLPIVG